MKYISYWHDTAPSFADGRQDVVGARVDVAVIGGGFTGLTAAYRLARLGADVAVLEARHVGAGASGRNGGHLNNGIAHGYADAKARFGAAGAGAIYRAYDRSIELIEETIAEAGIACDFRRCGRLKLASKASHVAGLQANFDLIHTEVDPDTRWLERGDLGDEVGSDAFHGAMLSAKSAMMHMGRYASGLAAAAHDRGARIWEGAPVTAGRRLPAGWELSTPLGTIRADRVIAATNAYSAEVPAAPLSYFRRRIVPVGSFVLATRPLSVDEAAAVMPGNRNCVTSMNIGNYFRLSPDRRLIFGGRARFSAVSNRRSDIRSGAILRAERGAIFPRLADVEIDYCWSGLVGMTKDRFPRFARPTACFMPWVIPVTARKCRRSSAASWRTRPPADRFRPRSTASTGRPFPAISASPGSCPWWACGTG